MPPEINFSSIADCTVPIHIFSAGEDNWSDSHDTDYLFKQISQVWTSFDAKLFTRIYKPSEHERQLKNLPSASHLSFFIGKDMSYT